MTCIDFTFLTDDGVTIYCKKWESPEVTSKGIVQIAHGMAEHIERYDLFANTLAKEGYIVYGNDHRGHGKTGTNAELIGFFADENGFDRVVEDMIQLTEIIIKNHPNIPTFLLGHSMGSFLSRRYIQTHGDELAGVILSGTGGDPGLIGKVGLGIAKFEMKRKGKKTKSPLMKKLTFGSYNKHFRPNRTEFDWLSRDDKEVDKYIADSLCGGIFTAGFFYDLVSGVAKVNNHSANQHIPKGLPMYFIAGDKDPVGNYSKGVLQAANMYKNLEMKDVTVQLYENSRHEILNEINKEEVYKDVINWLNMHI
ncbi:alpha/beta hydrolase [Fredinandcohnia sp. QZ13]|uniref:alpha/beta hydrolase n=1 Tax=Fredinandcohnia sp. QZ13 TaxID=3073144 RepID=UPI0028532B32|nr:alpha/beta hydrolase [Fredinandcohnia sp. QZ13]MDR4887287.1 alpha/beta hydrolase [Fredinandcohnia sp. QZ13]